MTAATTLAWPAPALAVSLAAGARRAAARADAVPDFDDLVRSQKDGVFRVALSVLGPGREAEAEDVTQEVFVRVYRSLSSFRGESRLSTWIYRTAFNLAVDHRRRLARRPEAADDDAVAALPAAGPGIDPYRESRRAERARAVRAAVLALSEEQRSVLHLHYWMGHTVAEIGELLGLPEGTVKSHLHRGRERLGKELARASHQASKRNGADSGSSKARDRRATQAYSSVRRGARPSATPEMPVDAPLQPEPDEKPGPKSHGT